MFSYYYPVSGLINAIFAAGLGIFVYTRNPSDRRYITYGIFCLSLFVWGFAYFFWLTSRAESNALFWTRVLMAGAFFLPVTAYHHVVQLIGISARSKVRLVKAGYLLTLCLLFLSPTSLSVSSVSPKLTFHYWPNPGPAFHIHFVMFVFFASMTVYELYRAHVASMGRRRTHLRILLITIALAFIGGGTNYFLWYDIGIPPFGNILVAFYIIVFAYTIIAYRLMDIEVIVKKSLIYAFLLLALLIPCYLLVIWGQLAAFGSVNYYFSLFTLTLLMLVGFLYPKFRFRTEEAFERVLFKKRYDHWQTLLRSSKDMISMVDLEMLCHSLVITASRALGTEKASLFLSDEIKGSFDLRAGVGINQGQAKDRVLGWDDPLVRRLERSREALVREELEISDRTAEDRALARHMEALGAEVALPLMSKDKLIGILNLGHKAGGGMFSYEDLEILSTLANQAAIALENARLYENLKQSQSILRRQDRLSSLGMLTAGLAHEIRNPLVAIRTFTQLLPERYRDAEFRDSFQALALKEVDRICGLVNDLLSFARPSAPKVSAEDMNEIVESIARILETEAKEKGVEIEIHLGDDLPKIFIDKEQIKQVCMNIILNAIQSIEGRGVVAVSTRPFLKDGVEEFVQVEFKDNGVGIQECDLENIFNPFFTTKSDGSGLGLSICHQIVREHGGYIVVESKVGRGTTFFVNLPATQVNHRGANPLPQIHEKDFGR